MKFSRKKLKIGIIGCGAIGSRMAKSIHEELKEACQLTCLYDIDTKRAIDLAQKLKIVKGTKATLDEALKHCDFIIEAVTAKNAKTVVRSALTAKKGVLSMSVGQLLNARDLFALAQKYNCPLLIPSGAIAGLDAVKAASQIGIDSISLTTRKPLSGFQDNPYLRRRRINLSHIKKETTIFEGTVGEAVKHFPQNINVAATLALASQAKRKLKVRILTAPQYASNSHEIELRGAFGHIKTTTENMVCPDNPKTSYLAVLSGIQTLKEFCTPIVLGT